MPDNIEWPYASADIVRMLPKLHPEVAAAAREELKRRSPVPWCPQPEQCAVTHRCPKVPVCSE